MSCCQNRIKQKLLFPVRMTIMAVPATLSEFSPHKPQNQNAKSCQNRESPTGRPGTFRQLNLGQHLCLLRGDVNRISTFTLLSICARFPEAE